MSIADRVITKQGTLFISKITFGKKSKWVFYHDGIRLSAKINGDELNRMVDSGHKFRVGDKIEAVFEITQRFDKPVNTYINKGFEVKFILTHNDLP